MAACTGSVTNPRRASARCSRRTSRLLTRPPSIVQQRIREDLKAGRRSLFKPARPQLEPSQDILDQRLAEELGFVARTLEHLGASLADDPILVRRYGLQLQSIDLVKQVLTNVGRIVATRDRAAAVEQVSLPDLKARLKRRQLRSVTD